MSALGRWQTLKRLQLSTLPQKADIARWPAVRPHHDARLLLRQINEGASRRVH